MMLDNRWKIQCDWVSQKRKKKTHVKTDANAQTIPSSDHMKSPRPTHWHQHFGTPNIAKSQSVRNVSLLGCFGRTVNLSHDFSKTVLFSCNLHAESTGTSLIIGWHKLLFFHTNYVSLRRKKRRKTVPRRVLKKLRWQQRRTQQGRRGRSQKEQQKVNRRQEKKDRLPFFSLLFGWWKRARWSWWSVVLACWMGPTSRVRWR